MGALPRRMTPSMSNATPKDGLKKRTTAMAYNRNKETNGYRNCVLVKTNKMEMDSERGTYRSEDERDREKEREMIAENSVVDWLRILVEEEALARFWRNLMLRVFPFCNLASGLNTVKLFSHL